MAWINAVLTKGQHSPFVIRRVSRIPPSSRVVNIGFVAVVLFVIIVVFILFVLAVLVVVVLVLVLVFFLLLLSSFMCMQYMIVGKHRHISCVRLNVIVTKQSVAESLPGRVPHCHPSKKRSIFQ